jgi:protein-histidine pros-kinase
MTVCPACRSRNSDAATKCWSCGSALVPPLVEPASSGEPDPKSNEPVESADEIARRINLEEEKRRAAAERREAEQRRIALERLRHEAEARGSKAAEERARSSKAAEEEARTSKAAEERARTSKGAEQKRAWADEKNQGASSSRDSGGLAPPAEPVAAPQPLRDLSLLARFALLIVLVLGAGLALGGKVWHDYLQREARHQVLEQAQLMIQSATAMRTYTEKQIQPLVGVRRDSEFHPQWVPFYAASQTFKYLSADYPQYTYKEAALNPMNERDRAVDWEADVINYFRNNPGKTEFSGERNDVTGRSLYFAHPIAVEADCLGCHGSVANAPPKMVSFYGPVNGFGWRLNEIIGAQIVSVPTTVPFAIAEGNFRAWLGSVIALALLTLITVGAALTLWVTQPVKRLTAAAGEISQGHSDIPDLPARGKDEIGLLEAAFNRMRRSLAKHR